MSRQKMKRKARRNFENFLKETQLDTLSRYLQARDPKANLKFKFLYSFEKD